MMRSHGVDTTDNCALWSKPTPPFSSVTLWLILNTTFPDSLANHLLVKKVLTVKHRQKERGKDSPPTLTPDHLFRGINQSQLWSLAFWVLPVPTLPHLLKGTDMSLLAVTQLSEPCILLVKLQSEIYPYLGYWHLSGMHTQVSREGYVWSPSHHGLFIHDRTARLEFQTPATSCRTMPLKGLNTKPHGDRLLVHYQVLVTRLSPFSPYLISLIPTSIYYYLFI